MKAILALLTALLAGQVAWTAVPDRPLTEAFRSPPNESKPWCYWWWLNGAASKEGITRDFEEMRQQGISGALLFDAGEAGPEAPRGPAFMSAAWRELYRHALREADRCGIVLGVNLCSGWDAGGPWVTHEHAAKKLVSAQTLVKGPGRVSITLPKPPVVQGFYREIAVLAVPIADHAVAEIASLSKEQLTGKALSARLLWPHTDVIELTKFLNQNEQLDWTAPGGNWLILRIGCTLHGDVIKCVGSGPTGLELDPMSAGAMDAHFAETGAKLIADAGPLAGKTLQYFHIDSWSKTRPFPVSSRRGPASGPPVSTTTCSTPRCC